MLCCVGSLAAEREVFATECHRARTESAGDVVTSRRDEVSLAQHVVLGSCESHKPSPVGTIEVSFVPTGLGFALGDLSQPRRAGTELQSNAPAGHVQPDTAKKMPADSVTDPGHPRIQELHTLPVGSGILTGRV